MKLAKMALVLALAVGGCDLSEEEPECFEDFSGHLYGSDVLVTCSFVLAQIYGLEATCLADHEDPEYFNTWDPEETPEICAHYGPFCWQCGQVHGDLIKAAEAFNGRDVAGCLDDLGYDLMVNCDEGYIESAGSGQCWLITTGGEF